ncbi:MAG: hypothetical protein GX442_20880 [Candidatus Riflebacteria bacterium]|nr:hypothetical protein [Candidatus Riflebacteria bacterium]
MFRRLSVPVLVLTVVTLVTLLSGAAAARSLTGGRGIPVVAEPRDLNLVNLRPLTEYLYADLKNKGDFGRVRRLALDLKARQVGVPDPRKKNLHAGMVIKRGSSGHTSAILVAVGDFTFKDLRASIEKDYRDYLAQTRGTGSVSDHEVAGLTFTRFPYTERPFEVNIAQLPGQSAYLVAAVPKGDYGVLEETVAVVRGEEKLNEAVPTSVEAETSFQLTPREVERLVKFNRPRSALRQKFAKGMRTVAQKLGIPQSDDETVPLAERLRGQLAQCRSVTVKYAWDTDARGASAYTVNYVIQARDEAAADTLRELISEQITRLTEQSSRANDTESLGRLTVSGSGTEVTMGFLLDSPEAQYDHTSLLLSQVFRFRNLVSLIDGPGREAPAGN